MATMFEVIVPFETPSASEVAQTMLDEIDRLEAQLTVYRDSSEVSRLNTRAADQPVRVEPNLFELLTLAAQVHRETDGAFDISVGAASRRGASFAVKAECRRPKNASACVSRSACSM